MQKIWRLKFPFLEEFRSKFEILNTHNLFCWKFSDVRWKIVTFTHPTFYAFANIAAGGIMFPDCSCIPSPMRPCVLKQTLLARYLAYLLTEFDQTFTTNGLWGKDEHVKFWDQAPRSRWGQICSVMHFLSLSA